MPAKNYSMKQKIILFTIILIVFGLGITEVTAISDAETQANTILNKNNTDSDVLIVYFSRTGENYNVGNVEVGNTATRRRLCHGRDQLERDRQRRGIHVRS